MTRMAPSRFAPLGPISGGRRVYVCGSLCLALLGSACSDSEGGRRSDGRSGRVSGALAVFTPGVATAGAPALRDAQIRSALARVPDILRAARAPRKEQAAVQTTSSSLEATLPGLLPTGMGAGSGPREVGPGAGAVPGLVPPAYAADGFVFGEVIVTLREDGLAEIPTLDATPGLARYAFSVGAFGSTKVVTVRFRDRAHPAREIGEEETRLVRAALDRHDAFVRAEFNHWRHATAVPNDPSYGVQWHYPQLNLPAAWDITTGSPNVVVAIIDDGVNPHPDLDRVVPGYDMVSDVVIAGDGDGRDPFPFQVPLSHGTTSVWHGTHVAGTVGATTNNGAGASGVDWQARLLPVRVLGRVVPGRGAGTAIDVIAGITWAAGLEVPGVPPNPTPAQVLNLSLGGGPVIQAEQDAIDAARAQGGVIVVAAGNENADASGQSLAGYDGVIVVGATDFRGDRAPYSNFGGVIDVMAPGGDEGADANADGNPDGVLSTYLDEQGTRTGFQFLQGTSMAAPHVAGVVALMKSVNPDLSAEMAERILKETASPASRCNEGCGAGLVNAAAAVLRARGGADPNRPAALALGAERINLGARESGGLQVFNGGGGQLTFQARFEGGQANRLRFEGPATGTLGAGAGASLDVRVDRAGLADGDYQSLLVVSSDAGQERAAVLFRVGAADVLEVGVVVVATVGFDAAGEVVIGGAAEAATAGGYRFDLTSTPGEWLVVALADRNGNEELDEGDFWGLHRSLDAPIAVTVEAGGVVPDVDFTLVPYVDGDDVTPQPCTGYRMCIEGCAGDPACTEACPVEPACQACFTEEVAACANQASCSTEDLGCLCTACEPALDACFGPKLCTEGGGAVGVGGACDGAAQICEAPFECDTSVTGGYCTRDCALDGNCGADGICVEVPNLGSFCFAECVGPGTCPRSADECIDVGGIGACFPN